MLGTASPPVAPLFGAAEGVSARQDTYNIRHGMNISSDVYASLQHTATRYTCSNVNLYREWHCVVEAVRCRNIFWMHWLSVHL